MSSWWTINESWDVDQASDGVSRFGRYLAEKAHGLPGLESLGPGDVDNEWVIWVWATATPPIMAPGYASWRNPVWGTELGVDPWEGRLSATVTVLSKVHLRGPWQTWQEPGVGSSHWDEPAAGTATALGQVQLTSVLELPALWRPDWRPGPDGGRQLLAAAKEVVDHVATALDARFGEAVDQIAATEIVGP